MPQVFDGRLFELTFVAVGRLGGNSRLQARVEHLIGVEFRAVAGQVEHLNVFLVLLQPRLDQLGVMNLQVVQHQEHLGSLVFAGLLRQPFHEVDQDGGIHGALKDLGAHLAPVGDAGDDGLGPRGAG